MWTAVAAGVLALVLAADVIRTQACSSPNPSPSPTPTPAPAPGAEVFTTADGVRFTVDVVAANLQIPWSLVFAPDGRLFVTERPGRVRIVDLAARTMATALTLEDSLQDGEAGTLGLALDPSFASNRLAYLYYTARVSGGAVNRVVRFREVSGQLGERVVLLDNIPAAGIHDGGRIRFGPDGLLYITAGDAASSSLAQDAASLAGKILRINRDGTTPRDNPFSSPVYSYGHRNPQGIDWHPATGDLWASEHGNAGNDEINVIERGVNYGWPRIEGNQSMAGMQTPITFYSPAIAPSGASFYRGQRFPAFVNNFFVATLRGTHIRRIRIDSNSPRRLVAQEALLEGRFGRIRDVISGPDGLLYFATSNNDGRGSVTSSDDRIARLVPAS
jgi:glucose/arabinose dehydrogenase